MLTDEERKMMWIDGNKEYDHRSDRFMNEFEKAVLEMMKESRRYRRYGMPTEHELTNWFRYHPPTAGDRDKYDRLRCAAKKFAQDVMECTPPCADQSAAIRKIREAVMTANAAIACDGK